MKKSIKLTCLLSLITLSLNVFANSVEIKHHEIRKVSEKQLELKSTQGIELKINYLYVQSSATGSESGISVENVNIQSPSNANIQLTISTTCLRRPYARNQPFMNQEFPPLELKLDTNRINSTTVPAKNIVLFKNVKSGEVHDCEVNLKFEVDNKIQIDPINGTEVFHPRF